MSFSEIADDLARLIDQLYECDSDARVASELNQFFSSLLKPLPIQSWRKWRTYSIDIVAHLIPEHAEKFTVSNLDRLCDTRVGVEETLETEEAIPYIIHKVMIPLEGLGSKTTQRKFATRVQDIIEYPVFPPTDKPCKKNDILGVPMWLLYPQILDANEGIFEEGVAESLLIDCILSLQEMVALSEPSEAELNTMDVPALRSLADTLRIKLDEDVSNFEQE